ncbi:MAG: hydrogenase expression/formation protein HupK [Paracoccaceae bacterium]|nr:hydrogenase expression/formation protein HupK [Paracoccaceae bacterium]
MLDAAPSLVAVPAPKLPVAGLVTGKPAGEVAELLPRLFNLCRAAQSLAVRHALGLAEDGAAAEVAAEIRRDHLMRFFVVWPRHFGQSALSLPEGWQVDGERLRHALFGPLGRLPGRPDDFAAHLGADTPVAATLRRIDTLFRPGEAVADGLPPVAAGSAFDAEAAVENSIAARHLDHPVLRSIEARTGRGPFWRAVARAYDLDAVLDGRLAPLAFEARGKASVVATRGLYSVAAATGGGRVTAFHRVTPTDHLTAPGGILDRTLASFPADRAAVAPLLLDILDPCTPIRLKEVADA